MAPAPPESSSDNSPKRLIGSEAVVSASASGSARSANSGLSSSVSCKRSRLTVFRYSWVPSQGVKKTAPNRCAAWAAAWCRRTANRCVRCAQQQLAHRRTSLLPNGTSSIEYVKLLGFAWRLDTHALGATHRWCENRTKLRSVTLQATYLSRLRTEILGIRFPYVQDGHPRCKGFRRARRVPVRLDPCKRAGNGNGLCRS